MHKHKLIELQKVIEERIGSLTEEIEIATNVKLNPLYIIDRKDEIDSLQWTTRIIKWILDRAVDGRQQLGVTKTRLELEDIKKFENILQDKIQELEIKLEDSGNDREKEVLVNQIDTLKCVLGYLFNLKSDGDKTRAIEIGGNNNFQQTSHETRMNTKLELTV
jgi:transcriptional regulator of heat shock response